MEPFHYKQPSGVEEDDGDDYDGDIKADGTAAESSKDGRKGVINRVNRACNNCRRMKMRCVGAEDPPCKRCRNGGLKCIMEKPGRGGPDAAGGEDRIRSLESQVMSMQNTLSDLVQTLRANLEQPPHRASPTAPFFPPPPPPQTLNPSTSLHYSPSGVTPPFHASVSTISPYATQLAGSADAYGSPAHAPKALRPAWPSVPRQEVHMSLPPSRAGSEAPADILAADEIVNPLGTMSNMAGLAEAAVKLAREREASTSETPDEHGRAAQHDGTAKRDAAGEAGAPVKRARFNSVPHAVVESPQSVSTGKGRSRSKKTHVHAYPDAVTEGFVSEEEGRELMRIFYAGSSNFIPCFDPTFDTWEALRVRSPFSITAIIMVGARVRDGGGPISEVQRLCLEHAQRIAVGTLFNPVPRIEAVQAMILLAAFSENGWLPGGHAVRMAIDMGVNKSFQLLLRTGMGKGKTPEELEEERHLVVHSRAWFCLYLMEHQMAYGMGRPAILREDEAIHQCRRLLDHPLSITSDARLVSTVELTALRAPLHIELTAAPDQPIDLNTLKRLKNANDDFNAWQIFWDRVLSERFGKGKGDFFRESLVIQRQYAECVRRDGASTSGRGEAELASRLTPRLFVNSQLLRGIREPSDVVNMPEEKRALAIRAMRNAQHCIEICLRGENYRNGLQYAVHYTHVCAAFAASFLIRIARLFPQELNLKKTARDVEELASVLSQIPAGRYARSLRLILRRARRAKVIPAPSNVNSPTRGAVGLPHTPGAGAGAFSPSQLVNPSYLPTPTATGSGSGSGGRAPPPPAVAAHQGLVAAGIAALQSQPQPQTQAQPSAALAALSPGTLLLSATQMMHDSPSSSGGHELSEFDLLFAQENLERAGLQLGEGDALPLFLDGHSLGGTTGPHDAPFVGLENWFLPVELDGRLARAEDSTGTGQADVWW
ncbi:hypothetical protein Q5752_001657 [Cryptotrichosporon argae]